MKTILILFTIITAQANASIQFQCSNDSSTETEKTVITGTVEFTGENFTDEEGTFPVVKGTMTLKTDYHDITEKNVAVKGMYNDGNITGIKGLSLMSTGARDNFSMLALFIPSQRKQGSFLQFNSFTTTLNLACKEI